MLADELCAVRAANAALVQRLSLAYSALHVEQVAHDTCRATLERLKKAMAAVQPATVPP